tara:strand:- start:82 stop:285 length:204 start_codon:yes stop_codon:yes gene_type:complete
MTPAETLITGFHSNPVKFFAAIDGSRMVEVLCPNSFTFKAHEVMVLAKEIMTHKRMMNRLRTQREAA